MFEVYSRNCELFVFWELFTSKFSPTLSSRSVFHVSVTQKYTYALKYTAPWLTLLTNCNWGKTGNRADNCCLLLTNCKQTPTHELHCSPWNIMPSSSPQVNYFPYRSSGMLIHRQNSNAPRSKRCTGRREAQSHEPVNKVKKNSLYIHI
jgi:hypothetical protein